MEFLLFKRIFRLQKKSCKQSSDLSCYKEERWGQRFGNLLSGFSTSLDIWLQTFINSYFLILIPKPFSPPPQHSSTTSVSLIAAVACLECLTFQCWTLIYASDIHSTCHGVANSPLIIISVFPPWLSLTKKRTWPYCSISEAFQALGWCFSSDSRNGKIETQLYAPANKQNQIKSTLTWFWGGKAACYSWMLSDPGNWTASALGRETAQEDSVEGGNGNHLYVSLGVRNQVMFLPCQFLYSLFFFSISCVLPVFWGHSSVTWPFAWQKDAKERTLGR